MASYAPTSAIRCRIKSSCCPQSESLHDQTLPHEQLLQKGHRVGVDIIISNFSCVDVNPNTGEPLRQHTHTITATNGIHQCGGYPMHIERLLVQPR